MRSEAWRLRAGQQCPAVRAMGLVCWDGRAPLSKRHRALGYAFLLLLVSCSGTAESAESGLWQNLNSGLGYKLIKANVECKSSNVGFGQLSNVSQCAASCRTQTDCAFFIFGQGQGPQGNKSNSCFQERTTSVNCTEGWESDSYSFYELLPVGAPFPPLLVTIRPHTL